MCMLLLFLKTSTNFFFLFLKIDSQTLWICSLYTDNSVYINKLTMRKNRRDYWIIINESNHLDNFEPCSLSIIVIKIISGPASKVIYVEKMLNPSAQCNTHSKEWWRASRARALRNPYFWSGQLFNPQKDTIYLNFQCYWTLTLQRKVQYMMRTILVLLCIYFLTTKKNKQTFLFNVKRLFGFLQKRRDIS